MQKRRKRGRKVGLGVEGEGGFSMKKHSMDRVERGRCLLLAGGRSVFCRHCMHACGRCFVREMVGDCGIGKGIAEASCGCGKLATRLL